MQAKNYQLTSNTNPKRPSLAKDNERHKSKRATETQIDTGDRILQLSKQANNSIDRGMFRLKTKKSSSEGSV